MYWTTSLGATTTNLDGILEKGVSGLDELLELDNIILRTRNGDERLLAYLTLEKVLVRLVEYAMGHGLNGEKGMRYPLIACELLCCEQPPIWMALQKYAQEALAALWKFPDTGRPLAPFLVCWTRLLGHLLTKMPVETGGTLKHHPDFVTGAIEQLQFPEICEALFKLTALTTGMEGNRVPILWSWLAYEQRLLERIFGLLSQEHESETHVAVQNFIAGLLAYPFMDDFPFENIIKAIIKELGGTLDRVIVTEPDQSLFAAVSEIIGYVIVKTVSRQDQDRWRDLIEQLAMVLLPHLPQLHLVLAPRSKSFTPYCSPAGPVNPVGLIRLKAAKFFADAVLLNSIELTNSIKNLGTANALFELFFLHPHSNLLHAEVADFIRNIFTGDYNVHRDLIISIFKDARLTNRIIKTQRINDSVMYPILPLIVHDIFYRQRPRGNRLSHMGHITLISDEIFKLLKVHKEDLQPILMAELGHEDWIEYEELSYRETKIKDGLVLGGARAPPPPTEDSTSNTGSFSFNSLFSSGTDEQLARYFCQQVIANLPNRFVFTDDGADDDDDDDEIDKEKDNDDRDGDDDDDDNRKRAPWHFDKDEYEGSSSSRGGDWDEDRNNRYRYRNESCNENISAPSIAIPVEPNGFDNFLEMEMRFSSLADLPGDSPCSSDEEEDLLEGEGKSLEVFEWVPSSSKSQSPFQCPPRDDAINTTTESKEIPDSSSPAEREE